MFPTFPEFKELNIDDFSNYEELIKDYPPVSDITFSSLMIWWSKLHGARVATLNGNLVVEYEPFSNKAETGWAVIGTDNVRQTIDEVFKFQAQNGQVPKLLHVPDFVLDHCDNKDGLNVTEETDYNEYILDAVALSTLDSPDHSRTRRKVSNFHRQVGPNVRAESVDLDDVHKSLLISKIRDWFDTYGSKNDLDLEELTAITTTISEGDKFGMQALEIYINDDMKGCVVYRPLPEKGMYIINHIKVQPDIPHIFDYATQQIATEAVANGVKYLNFEMDLGIEGLRIHKMRLRPVRFFKKYTVTQ